MKIKNIIDSINCVDFLNKIDNLIYKLLYNEKEGYILKQSKEAIDSAQLYLEKFNNEINEISTKEEYGCVNSIIEEKRNEFILKLKEHYYEQTNIWADEVYKNLEDNSLLAAFIYKKDKKMLDKVYNRMLCAINWISGIKKYDELEKEKIFNIFKEKFTKAINAKDNEFTSQKIVKKTNSKIFLKIFNYIADDEEIFLSLDLNQFSNSLIQEDMNYFLLIQNNFKSYKKTIKKDELSLIKAGVELLNTKNEDEKYQFIKTIDNDFKNFYSENKRLNEQDKLNLIKKRLEINLKYKKSNSEYYKKLLAL